MGFNSMYLAYIRGYESSCAFVNAVGYTSIATRNVKIKFAVHVHFLEYSLQTQTAVTTT